VERRCHAVGPAAVHSRPGKLAPKATCCAKVGSRVALSSRAGGRRSYGKNYLYKATQLNSKLVLSALGHVLQHTNLAL